MYEAVVPGPRRRGRGGGPGFVPDPWPSPARRPGAARGLQLRHRCTALYTITRYLLEVSTKGFVDNKSKESKCSGG